MSTAATSRSDHRVASSPRTYRTALVLGLGGSGEAAARLLRHEGTDVVVVDRGDTPALAARAAALRADGLAVALKVQTAPAGTFDIAIVSPGIARNSDWLRAVVPPAVPVISELELAATRCHCPLLAITGTNGKSTLTKLCTEALVLAGKRAVCGGNYGTPLAALAPQTRELDWVVVEVSSFQMEAVDSFHPRVAVLLNLQPNHLDRHGDLDTYAQLKWHVFRRQGRGDTAVVLDTLAPAGRAHIPAAVDTRTFGLTDAAGFRYIDRCVRAAAEPVINVPLRGTCFGNPILGQAAAAAVAALGACGVSAAVVAEALRRYQPLPHRMNELGVVRGVTYINDSKATTLAAMGAALGMTNGGVHLIAGGLLKEHDLGGVQEMLVKHVRAVYLIGKAATRMQAAWSDRVECRLCGDLEHAFAEARREARPGDTILLSPGCASFDQFKSFEERGERFADFVRRIREEAGHEDVMGS
ncbi:MAG: UDP-N-acetylmuramoyl-L-alanine--D-glutamate ligase [Lentisphaerae bacterium]|nr:UDP-N-acetylmuramoyl-L-alanine--D-glutamate ligase [Lentisphaerota bacterium]